MAKLKNECGKTRPKEDPYEIWEVAGWRWLVLKKNQADDRKPYATWYCFVTSPACPDGEYGDMYAADIMGSAQRVK